MDKILGRCLILMVMLSLSACSSLAPDPVGDIGECKNAIPVIETENYVSMERNPAINHDGLAEFIVFPKADATVTFTSSGAVVSRMEDGSQIQPGQPLSMNTVYEVKPESAGISYTVVLHQEFNLTQEYLWVCVVKN